MTPAPTSKAERWAFIGDLADQLNERQRGPRAQIARIVNGAGVDFVREVYQLTLETEAQGGLMLPDGSRRRTVGGVFFYLARTRLNEELRQEIFPRRHKRKQGLGQSPPTPSAWPPLVWEERAVLIERLLTQPGTVSSLKVVLMGRLERLEHTEERVTAWMADRAERVTLPRGVPRPPSETTVYKVYLAAKQWQRVESALDNPEDRLIIEGMAAFDTDSQAMVVYATQASSKLLEAQKRAAKTKPAPLQT